MMRNEKPGGHGDRAVAVATMDMALWDATAKLQGKPLYRILADRYGDGQPDRSVPVYAAGGYYYPGKDVSALKAEMRSYLDGGYTTVKIKIGGATVAQDRNRIEAVLSLLPSSDCLCVDANGRFDLPTALEYARALEPYKLKWYEEPGDPLDFNLLAEVAAVSATPIATGENLFSNQDSRNLIRYGGLNPSRDFLQMDPALSYGIVEYRELWRCCGPRAGLRGGASRMAGTRWRYMSQRDCTWEATRVTRACSCRSEVSPIAHPCETAKWSYRTPRALGLNSIPIYTRCSGASVRASSINLRTGERRARLLWHAS